MLGTTSRADNCLNELGADARLPRTRDAGTAIAKEWDGHDAARRMAINGGIARQVMMAWRPQLPNTKKTEYPPEAGTR